jgi:hypothetical protein
MIPAILDIEASGLGNGSYPIEVGYVLADGSSDCMIIRPEPEWQHWDEVSAQLHGLSRELLLRRGLPVREVALRLNRQLEGLCLYSDAWGNDYSWLSLLFESAGLLQRFKLQPLRRLLDEHQLAVWHTTRAQVEQELALPRHRASGDARVLQRTWLRTRAESLAALALPHDPVRYG